MRIKIYGINGHTVEEWETETPLKDLISRKQYKPHKKLFKLNGEIIDGLVLFNLLASKSVIEGRALEIYLAPRGPIFTLPGLILLGLTAVTGLAKLVFFRPQQQRQQEIIRNDVDRSPVNTYAGRTNRSRPQSRVPDIYGMHRIYPDLIAPEFWEYVGRSQRISYLMALGLGTYDINEIRLGDTPVNLVTGLTVLVHPPNDPLSFFNLVVRNVDNLQSTELRFNEFTQYFTLRGDQQIDIWVDIELPNGLYRVAVADPTDIELAAIEIEVQVINEAATYNRGFIYRLESNSQQSLIYTFKISQFLGQLPADTYRVRFRNALDFQEFIGNDDQVFDTLNLIRVGSVEVLEQTVYPETTTCEVRIDTSNFLQDQLNKRINFLVTRRLRAWTGVDMTPNIFPTRRMADALVEIATGLNGGNYSDAQLDLVGLYTIQLQLEAIGEGTFDAVIDQRRSVDSELQLVANSGRVQIYRYGNKLFFVRDQLKTVPNTLVNGRSKVTVEDRTFNFLNSDDPDAVEVTWINPVLDYRPSQELYPPDSPQLNVERIELIGVTSQLAAYRRAKFEYLAITQRRDALKVKVTDEGRLFQLLDWAKVSDGIQEAMGEGECTFDGNIVTLDRNLAVTVGDFILIRSAAGDQVGTFTITAITSNSVVTVSPTPTFSALPDQAQVKYLFALKNQTADITDWLISRVRPDQNLGAWNVEMIPYVTDLYTVDSEGLP